MIRLRPAQSKLYRFLASCWRNEFGWQDKRALNNYKKALELLPEKPENWSSYGKACLAQDIPEQFLIGLAIYEQTSLSKFGINDFVLSVKADCLNAVSSTEESMALRQLQIDEGTKEPEVYVGQTQAYLAQNNPEDKSQCVVIS